jgi:transposase
MSKDEANEIETEVTQGSTQAGDSDYRGGRVGQNVAEKRKVGRPRVAMELVLEGLLFVLSEGCSWRAIDREMVSWNTVYQYFRLWCQRGVLERALAQLGPELTAGWHFLDSTHVKVHADATNPVGGQASQAIGRTKGGLNTKIHAVVNSDSEAVVIAISAGNEADISCAEQLVANLPKGSVVVADKAYDSDTLRDFISRDGNRACIPPRSNRLKPQTYSSKIYRRRHRVENFFQKIKRFRRVATRYDKLSESFFGFVCLAIFVTHMAG